MTTKQDFNTLPMSVQTEIKNTLRAYDKVNVTFENGKYRVSTGTCLTKYYADDFKTIGTYTKEEIYTADEMIINYVESFRSYPVEYKGKRDYSIMHEMEIIGWDAKIKFDANGNIELIK